MKNLIVSILILLVGPAFGQTSKDIAHDKKNTLNPWDNINGFRIATSYYKNFEFEASYLLSSYPRQEPGFGGFAMLVQYVGAGIEYVNVGNQHAIGAKLSYEANFSIFSAQVGGDILTSGQDFQYRILPRVGLSAFGIITAYYGWNHNLKKESALRPAEHIFTLQFNILNH